MMANKKLFKDCRILREEYCTDLENKFNVIEPYYTCHPLKVVKSFVVVLNESL